MHQAKLKNVFDIFINNPRHSYYSKVHFQKWGICRLFPHCYNSSTDFVRTKGFYVFLYEKFRKVLLLKSEDRIHFIIGSKHYFPRVPVKCS